MTIKKVNLSENSFQNSATTGHQNPKQYPVNTDQRLRDDRVLLTAQKPTA